VLAKKPVVVVFAIAMQDIQVVISMNTLGKPRIDKALHQINHRWAIRPPVRQLADEHESPIVRVRPIGGVAQVAHQ